MNNLKAFVKSILWVEAVSIFSLLASGLILTLAENGNAYRQSFFTYRIYHLDYLPAWFTASLILMAINGFWMFRLAAIEGSFYTPTHSGWGTWGVSVPINPLRLFAINLIAIPGILILFMIIKANGW